MTVLLWLSALWTLWIGANVALLLASPYLLAGASGPFTNGLRIVVPRGVAEKVTEDEMAALMAHERGHIALRHNFKNLALACFFVPRSAARMRRQEIEADDFAAARTNPVDLASALLKLSFNDFDWQRAARLRRMAAAT